MSANNTSTGSQQLSAEKKHLQKVEKELKQLKSSSNNLNAASPKIFEVAEYKELGDHLLVNFGVSEGTTQCLVVHKPIGTDYTIPEGSWVMSQARDIPGFLQTKAHPGLEKLKKNIGENSLKLALSKGLLIKKADGNSYYSETHTESRDKLMSAAKELRTLFAKAKGIKTNDAPASIYFMALQDAKSEIKYNDGLFKSEEYKVEVLPDLKKIELHRPHLITMQYQVAVPWLYGADVKQLNQLFYFRTLGQNDPAKVVPEDYNVLTYTFPVLKEDKFPDSDAMQILKETLQEFAQAQKANNVAAAESKAAARKGSKEEKKNLASEAKEANDELNASKVKVNRLNINFPTEAYKTDDLVLLKKSDMVQKAKAPPVKKG
jgi:hypothetical protein